MADLVGGLWLVANEPLRLANAADDTATAIQFTVDAAGALTVTPISGSPITFGCGLDVNGDVDFEMGADVQDDLTVHGITGLGAAVNTAAWLKLGLGSASVVPLLFGAGTLKTSAIDGAVEYDGAAYYATVGADRQKLMRATDQIAYTQLPTGGGTWANGGDLAITGGGLTLDKYLSIPNGTVSVGNAASGNAPVAGPNGPRIFLGGGTIDATSDNVFGSWMDWITAGPGGSSHNIAGLRVRLTSNGAATPSGPTGGYVGSGNTRALFADNICNGVGVFAAYDQQGNAGTMSACQGITTGDNTAVYGNASGGTVNIGLFGRGARTTSANDSWVKANVGVLGVASSSQVGAIGSLIGGAFWLGSPPTGGTSSADWRTALYGGGGYGVGYGIGTALLLGINETNTQGAPYALITAQINNNVRFTVDGLAGIVQVLDGPTAIGYSLTLASSQSGDVILVRDSALSTVFQVTAAGVVGAGTWAGTTITTAHGGTGLAAWTVGDVPYYASGTALSKLAIGGAGTVLTSTGTAPQWSTNIAYGALPTGGGTWANAGALTVTTGGASVAFTDAVGPNAWGEATQARIQHRFGGTFVAGSGGSAYGLRYDGSITPFNTNAGYGMDFVGSFGTNASHVHTEMASGRFETPIITLASGASVTDSYCLIVDGPAVTAVNNWSLWTKGVSKIGGHLLFVADSSFDVGQSGFAPRDGFFSRNMVIGGTLLVGTRQTYTVTHPTTNRSLDVTGATLAQLAQVLGTVIADIQTMGLYA